MQQSPLFSLIRAFAGAALLASAAQAAELGDIAVRSFIGQPLAADIELVSLAPDEVNALQVRLAQADVFRGANITMNPALASVRMSVVKRDQKQFLHVTTTRPIDADYVHLYVELSAAGRQDVRLATVWLQADPNPAPPVVAAEAGQIAAQARAERERMAKEAAAASAASAAANAAAAQAAALARERARPAPMPSAHESEVGVAGGLRASVAAPRRAASASASEVSAASAAPAAAAAAPVRRTPVSAAVRDLPERIAGAMGTPRAAPKKPAAKKEDAAAEGAVPLTVAQALLPLPPLPLPKGVKRQEAPAACTPASMSAKECMALDTHNAALSSKLVELEGKVKLLQGALGGSAAVGVATPGHASKQAAPVSVAPPKATAKTAEKASAAASAHAASSAAASPAASVPAKPTATAASAPAQVASAPPVPAAHSSASSAHTSAASAGAASAVASAPSTRAVRASASASGTASTSALAAQVETPAASASAGSGSASASASPSPSASAAASAAASTPVKLVRVLPKLKYKKEKPVERPTNYPALIAGGVGVLLLGAAGVIYLRKRKAGGAGPLKIWQGFRKKTPVDPAAAPAGSAAAAPSPRETATEPVA